MITVKATTDRTLNTPADIMGYLAETMEQGRFKPGDKVRIVDRSALPVSAFAGDVGIVVGFDTPNANFTSVRGLYSNGVVTSSLLPTDTLAPYEEEN